MAPRVRVNKFLNSDLTTKSADESIATETSSKRSVSMRQPVRPAEAPPQPKEIAYRLTNLTGRTQRLDFGRKRTQVVPPKEATECSEREFKLDTIQGPLRVQRWRVEKFEV